MSSSYLATALQILQNLLELQVGLICSIVKGCKVLGILGQPETNGLVHQVGYRPLDLYRLQSQCTVEVVVKIDRSSPCIRHHSTIPL